MQIKKLKIDDHLCLVDFEINFQTVNGGSSTILIGENGTGKSTMIDTVLEILMSFDIPFIEAGIDYNYEIEYDYAQTVYKITKDGHRYCIKFENEELEGKYSKIRKRLRSFRIFPQRIIAFYSGANNKIARIINRQNNLYVSKCRYILRQFLKSMNDDFMGEIPYFPKRKYNYCDEELTPIYLISILSGPSSFEKEYLQKTCHFSSVDAIDVSVNLDRVEYLFGNQKYNDEYPNNLFSIIDGLDI